MGKQILLGCDKCNMANLFDWWLPVEARDRHVALAGYETLTCPNCGAQYKIEEVKKYDD